MTVSPNAGEILLPFYDPEKGFQDGTPEKFPTYRFHQGLDVRPIMAYDDKDKIWRQVGVLDDILLRTNIKGYTYTTIQDENSILPRGEYHYMSKHEIDRYRERIRLRQSGEMQRIEEQERLDEAARKRAEQEAEDRRIRELILNNPDRKVTVMDYKKIYANKGWDFTLYGDHSGLDRREYGLLIKQKDLPAWHEAQMTWLREMTIKRNETLLGKIVNPILRPIKTAISNYLEARDRAKHPEKYRKPTWQEVRDQLNIGVSYDEMYREKEYQRHHRQWFGDQEAWEKTLDGQTIDDQMEEKRQKRKTRTGKKIKKA